MKKANTKEIVFLEEEADLPSPSSHSESEYESDMEKASPSSFPQEVPSIEEEKEDYTEVTSPVTDQNTPHFINEFTPLNDNNEFYDLQDAARYFSRRNETKVCHICGNPGHLAKNCPLAIANNVCFFCAQPTHNSRACPMMVCRRFH